MYHLIIYIDLDFEKVVVYIFAYKSKDTNICFHIHIHLRFKTVRNSTIICYHFNGTPKQCMHAILYIILYYIFLVFIRLSNMWTMG